MKLSGQQRKDLQLGKNNQLNIAGGKGWLSNNSETLNHTVSENKKANLMLEGKKSIFVNRTEEIVLLSCSVHTHTQIQHATSPQALLPLNYSTLNRAVTELFVQGQG